MASRRLRVGCLVTTAVVAGLAVGVGCCAYRLLGPSESGFERYRSPDLRFDAVNEHWSTFLDGYGRVWIAEAGDEDRSRWLEIAPAVDGHWEVDWLAVDHLLLTDYGAWSETRLPHRDTSWRGVRIETRSRPVGRVSDSPDGLHSFHAATTSDSRGLRSWAFVQSTWQNPEKGSLWLADEGPWVIEGAWRASDHLHVTIAPAPGVTVPRIASRWRGITITVEVR